VWGRKGLTTVSPSIPERTSRERRNLSVGRQTLERAKKAEEGKSGLESGHWRHAGVVDWGATAGLKESPSAVGSQPMGGTRDLEMLCSQKGDRLKNRDQSFAQVVQKKKKNT